MSMTNDIKRPLTNHEKASFDARLERMRHVRTGRRPARQPARHSHKGRPLLALAGAASVLVNMTVFVSRAYCEPLRVAKETTYITEPLKSDGLQVDYFAAIRQARRPENAATNVNGYRLLVRRLGHRHTGIPGHFAAVCKELGLDADGLRPDLEYQDPHDFLYAYLKRAPLDETLLDKLRRQAQSEEDEDVAGMLIDRLERPWTLDDLPMMAEWLEQNEAALDLVGRAVCKPTFYAPLVRDDEDDPLLHIGFEDIAYWRSLVRSLHARANHRIAIGDIDGAVDDIIASKRLGRHVGRGPSLLHWLLGTGFDQMADAIGIAGSLEQQPTEAQFQRLLAEVQKLPPWDDMQEKMLVERFMALDVLQLVAHGKTSFEGLGVFRRPDVEAVATLKTDWNVVARRFNKLFDEMLETGVAPAEAPFTPATVVSLLSVQGRSEFLARFMAAEFLSGWQTVWIREAGRRRDCAGRMQRITLAMLLYERNHGTLPPAWSADAAGNPLHSWRVLLLPYLGRRDLYERIRLDEPWDSEHNRRFHGEAVDVYRCPSHPAAAPGQTTYSVVVGPDMPFEAGEGKRPADLGPPGNNRILVVERTDPVTWMDPTREVTQAAAEQGIDEQAESPGRIGNHHRGANFGFRNGGVRCILQDTDRMRLRQWLRGTDAEKTDKY